MYILDSGSGGKLNMSAWHRRKVLAEEEALEQKEKEAAGCVSTSSGGKDIFESGASYNYTSPFKPNSAFHIRNRLLSKMGAPVSKLCHYGCNACTVSAHVIIQYIHVFNSFIIPCTCYCMLSRLCTSWSPFLCFFMHSSSSPLSHRCLSMWLR